MIPVPFRLVKALACNLANGSRAEPRSNVAVPQHKETKMMKILTICGLIENGTMKMAKTNQFKNNSSSALLKLEEVV
jgi:hypothetical protein